MQQPDENQPVDVEAAVMEAIDKGIAETPPDDVAPLPKEPTAVEDVDAPAAPAADTATAESKPEPTETDREVADLGLKGRTEERFRTLSDEVKSFAPIKEAIEKAGITDVATLPRLIDRVRDADDMITMVTSKGTKPEQFAAALDYIGDINAAERGDMKAAERLHTMLTTELANVAKMLGKEIPGVHDPLAAHPDLLEEVETGAISRQRALQIAQIEAQTKHATGAQQVQYQANQAVQERQAAYDAVQQQSQQWSAADPGYKAKHPILNAMAETIMSSLPPAQWLPEIQKAYARVGTLPIPAAVQPKAGATPIRGGGARPALTAIPKTAEEAIDMGIAAANAAAAR